MASLNKVLLIGNLGADPETRYTASGDAVCNIRIATTDTWRDKASGENRESTEWHKVVLYRRLGEIAGQYLKKGSSVYIEGRIKTRKWQNKDGQDQYTTEVEATELKMLGSKDNRQTQSENTFQPASRPRNAGQSNRPPANVADLDDDIPF